MNIYYYTRVIWLGTGKKGTNGEEGWGAKQKKKGCNMYDVTTFNIYIALTYILGLNLYNIHLKERKKF